MYPATSCASTCVLKITGSDFVANELGVALRAHDQAAAARNSLGQANGSKVHAIAKTARRYKACAAKPVRTEGMRLIDDQHTAAPPGNFDDVLESGKVAVGAVKRIDRYHAGSNPPDQAIEMLRVVVAEWRGLGARGLYAFPQR